MAEKPERPHPVYCECCPEYPQIVAQRFGDDRIEIKSRVHGKRHFAVVDLDKPGEPCIDSENS